MPSSSTMSNAHQLVARKYQEEIFVQAQKGNIIAYLQTGSGKTLISVLLIRWMCTLEKSKNKVIIFIVPKVTLVEQQAVFIQRETGLRVCQLHGALSIDLSDRPGWKKRFEGYDVFVMTAQLFLNILTHSLWSIDKVSLMVFDECHHARKNHPYNGILREYFQVSPPSSRPKVFGMTASPYWNEKDPTGSLITLETNLDAKIIGVRDYVDELKDSSPKPLEVIQEYAFPPEVYDFPKVTIFKCLKMFDLELWDRMDIPWSNIENRYYCTMSNLGPYCASLYLYNEIRHNMNRLLANSKSLLVQAEDEMDVDIPPKLAPIEIFDILDILDDFECYFSSPDLPNTIPIPIPLTWCSPKVKTLVAILLSYHSPTFQGIIFVEQRQVAHCLSRLLEAIPELQGLIRCTYLIGQGVNSEGVSKPMVDGDKRDPVQLFRDRVINILIATSVAEEGLDFPACDLVVRFDPLQHMVGYVQSRGRARNATSTYVIMIQKDDYAQLERYRALQRGETELSQSYQTRRILTEEEEDGGLDEDTDPIDMADRERYVVPSTGAVLTYDNAIGLLGHLCALIPRDSFTPVHVPKFSGDFQAKLRLPAGLPLLPKHLSYIGYPRRSKKEAKRSVAFQAVKRLLRLNVFDQYLLPISTGDKEPSSRTLAAKSRVPFVLTVDVKDPWSMGPRLWMHYLFIDGYRVAALITGTNLPPAHFTHGTSPIQTTLGKEISFDPDDELERRRIMNEFTKLGVWTRITASPSQNNSLYLVPLTLAGEIDFDSMIRTLGQPKGYDDWSMVNGSNYDRLLVWNINQYGRIYQIRRVRSDLNPLSKPLPGSRESNFPRYYDYYVDRWTRKKRAAIVPLDGPLCEVVIRSKKSSGAYPLYPEQSEPSFSTVASSDVYLLPQGCLRWMDLSYDIYRAYEVLPLVARRITDTYRVRCARLALALPPISDHLLIEAFTLPIAGLDFSNQRMETLGDAVLKLCTTVHILNQYPNRHEGQLSVLRKESVSNQFLLGRARDIGLEHYLSCEIGSVYKWRYSLNEDTEFEDYTRVRRPKRSVTRTFPRRNLQDCMEAVLGASFLEGGMPMALKTGTALGLTFGGPHPWPMRYHRHDEASQATTLFTHLEELLGYNFRHNDIIVEAVTHPSFATLSTGRSYQRLEFLGDAIIDMVVTSYLFNKFPNATSHQLALPRTKAVCAQTLANLAVRKLHLHKIMLVNNMELSKAMDRYVPVLQTVSGEEIVKRGWKFDPPKALSDVFESVIGAVLVDTRYDYDRTAAVIEHVMEDVLLALSPTVAQNPVSILLEWAAKEGCGKISFQKKMKATGEGLRMEGIAVSVHDSIVVGPIVSTSLAVAKFLASERAFPLLNDASSKFSLSKICDCRKPMDADNSSPIIAAGSDANEGETSDGAEDSDAHEATEVHKLLTQGLVDSDESMACAQDDD